MTGLEVQLGVQLSGKVFVLHVQGPRFKPQHCKRKKVYEAQNLD
jgi:hypothetical protein